MPVLVAALGPVMLKLAGQLADGTITWMTGPKTLESHIIPNINAGAESAGKPTPKIVAGFPVVLTNDEAGAREAIGKTLQIYGQLPSYRAMLDKEGVAGPAELAFAGDEATIRGKIQQLKDVGVTDFTAAIVATDDGAYERTQAFLASEV